LHSDHFFVLCRTMLLEVRSDPDVTVGLTFVCMIGQFMENRLCDLPSVLQLYIVLTLNNCKPSSNYI